MNKKFLRPEWQQLLEEERKDLLKQIGERYGMKLKKYAHFSRYGQELDTAVYLYQDSEFVFVPGDNVTLGYDAMNTEMDLPSRGALYEEMSYNDEEIEKLHKQIEEKYRYPSDKEELADYAKRMEELGALEILKERMLKNMFTPVRQAEIGPMLVECRTNEVDVDAVYTDMEESDGEGFYGREILIQQIEKEGFSIPTKDEWEYLCGGGCRTMFAWGDSFFEECFGDKDDIYDLKEEIEEKPNFFGLFIAQDSYEMEIVQGGGFKGGDGGCASCGGFDALDSLNYSPYVNDDWEDEEDMLEGAYIRRVIRIMES